MCEARTLPAVVCWQPALRRAGGRLLCSDHREDYWNARVLSYTPKALLQWARETRKAEYLVLVELNGG